MDRLTFFWLVPHNAAAVDIVLDEKNARFRDDVPCIATSDQTSNGPGDDVSETIKCLRCEFDHEKTSDSLVYFGRDDTEADIVLIDLECSRRHAFLFIDPTSLDLVCRDYSSNRLTLLFFSGSEPVGTWRAMHGSILEQAILTHSSTMLAIGKAQFTFRWHHPSLESEISAAKSSFARRIVSSQNARTPTCTSEVYQRNNVRNEFPEATDYHLATIPLAIMNLPIEIRHLIFRLVFGTEPIKLRWDPEKGLKVPPGFHTVQGCINILDASYQLLNPAYSSRELAADAASFFYHEKVLELSILDTQSLIWTLQHMPSVQPVEPLSCISRLRLWLGCDGLNIDPVGDKSYLIERGMYYAGYDWPNRPAIAAYKWTDTEIDDLSRACSAWPTNFPGLSQVEIHIRKQSLSFEIGSSTPDEEVPSNILASITPMIRNLRGHEIKSIKVYLHWQKFEEPESWPLPQNKMDSVEDITSWWDDYTTHDDKITCEENLKWLNSIPWHIDNDDHDYRRKEAIQASIARQEFHKIFKGDQISLTN